MRFGYHRNVKRIGVTIVSVFFLEFQRLFPVYRKIVVCVFIIGSRYLIGADFSEKLDSYQITVSKYFIFHIPLFLSS